MTLKRNPVAAIVLVLALLACTHAVRAAERSPDPELERESFKLADGWEVNLFAADPMIQKPIQMTWDAQGRLWCATSETYPQLKPGQVANDKVIILEDTNGDGRADKSTLFANGLLIPTGIEVGDGGAYVANSTEVIHFKDTKHPERPEKSDQRRVILSGFGTEDTHHIIHTFRWGPDGRLYLNQSIYINSYVETPHGAKRLLGSGVWRFRPDTMDLEVFSRGLVNPWGHAFDRWGQSFETDGAGGDGICYAFPGASYTSAAGIEKVLTGLNQGSPKYCSLEILSGRHIPDEYQGNMLTNDFRANRVCRFQVTDSGSGYVSKQMPDFIRSTDSAFRPVDIKMGPDGAIYIADWYNPIINHGEVDFRDARRDHTHGRIWRLTYKGRPRVPPTKLVGAPVRDVLEALRYPEDSTRQRARDVLRERGAKDVIPALTEWVKGLKEGDAQFEHDRLEALWTYETLDVVEPQLLAAVLKSPEPHARAAGVRIVRHWAGKLENPSEALSAAVADENPRVRLEAVRALAAISDPASVVTATRVLDKPMDSYLEYALWVTCNELQPVWMPAFQAGKLTQWGNAAHLNWALQAVKSPAALKTLVAQLKSGETKPQARGGLIDLIANIGGPDEAAALLDLAVGADGKDPATRTHLLAALRRMARQNAKPANDPSRLRDVLADKNEAVRAEAMRLAGAWKLDALRPELVATAEAPDSSETLRSAAIDGLSDLGGEESAQVLKKLAAAPTDEKVRRLAVAGLSAVSLNDAAASAADLLSSGRADADPSPLLSAFLKREGGGAALAAALGSKKLPPDVAKLALRYARNAGADDPALLELLTKAAGASSGPTRLSADEMKQTIAEVMQKGDAARGELIFRRAESGCLQCHAIGGAGGSLAPDLRAIGASAPADYLVDSVLDPNKAIKDGYAGVTVVTNSGEVYTGIKVRQTDKELILRDNAHDEIPVTLASIKKSKDAGSLMPTGLADSLTRGEFLDLMRFLVELGKPGPYGPSTAQVIRRWRVTDSAAGARESSLATLDAQNWLPAYSLVSGVLPLNGTTAVPAYARCEIDVVSAGKIRVLLNSAKGLKLWLDGSPVAEVTEDLTLDLPAGLRTLTFAINPAQRGGEGLRVEVADAPNSSAHAQPVGGK